MNKGIKFCDSSILNFLKYLAKLEQAKRIFTKLLLKLEEAKGK